MTYSPDDVERTETAEFTTPRSLEEMLVDLETDGAIEGDFRISPEANLAVFEMQISFDSGLMNELSLRAALRTIEPEEQYETLRALASLVGVRRLKETIRPADIEPTLKELSREVLTDREEATLSAEGITLYQTLMVQQALGAFTQESLVAAVQKLPTRQEKKALLLAVMKATSGADYTKLIKG